MIRRNAFLATAILSVLVVTVLSACDAQRTSNRTTSNKPLELQADGLLIKFKAEYAGNTSAAKDSRNTVLKTIGLKEAGPVGSLAKDWIRVVPTSQKASYLNLVKSLLEQPEIDSAEPNYLVYLQAVTPDDTLFFKQWGLNNNIDKAIDTDINASEAWSIRSEGKSVVAIIDTGIDYAHIDLKKNIWTNRDEVPNNGIDDDANGYIDDVYGWNFVNNTAETKDDNNHGTHVAGIIGARSNNGIGIAGVNGAARLMALKVLDKNGQGSVSSVIGAIQYAIEKGARISNLSLGTDYESKALYDAMTAANRLGHVVVAAAGNYGDDNDQIPFYPANYNLPNIISVAAVNQAGEVAPFSNYGANSVSIGAPGVGIVSTIISSNSSEELGKAYGVMSGSSCSAPFVAGVLSLAIDVNPNLSAADYKRVVVESARSLDTLRGRVANAAFLNAGATLQNVLTVPPSNDAPRPTDPTIPVVSPAVAEIPVGVALQLAVEGGIAPYTWSIDKPVIGNLDTNTLIFTGSQLGEVQITATDNTGVTSAAVTVKIVNMILSPNNIAEMLVGEKRAFLMKGGTAPYTWTIVANNGEAGVTVNTVDTAKAIVQAKKPGSFLISVNDSSLAGILNIQSNTITVTGAPLSISVPTNNVVNVGEQLELLSTGGDAQYTWKSSDPTIASIDANTGIVKGLRQGTVTITVTDGTGTTDTIALSVVVAPLTINLPPIDTLWIGNNNTVQLTASGGVAGYTWSSENAAIATVSTTGLVTAKSAGTVLIRVADTFGNTSVISITVKKVAITSPSTSYTVDDNVQLTAIGFGTLNWSITGTAATITNTGLLRAVTAGTVQVTVTDANNNSATVSITINALPLSLKASATEIWVGNGSTSQLTASGGVAGYSWSSDNTAIATVSATGLVTAKSAGTVTIRVSDSAGSNSAISITVKKTAITSSATSYTIGDSVQLTAVGFGTLNWSISGTAATITNTGVLNASTSGTVQVTVTDANNNSATVAITINALPLNLKASSTEIWIGNGSTSQLTASGGVAGYSWSSDNTAIATVSATGLVTAKSTGTVTIRVSDSAGSNSAISITVKKTAITSSATSYTVGDSVQLTAVGFGTLNWSISGTAATITNTGVLNALTSGTVQVTVVDANNNSATLSLTINALAPLTISATTTEIWVGNGNTLQLSGTGGKAPFTWSITSGSNIVTLNSSTGLVTAASPGTATIKVSDNFGNSSSISVTVKQVTLSSSKTTIVAGQTQQLSAVGLGTLSYKSSNTSVATVNSSGVISAIGSGNATITVTDANSNTASISIKVDPALTMASPSTTEIWTGASANTVTLSASGGQGSYTWTSSNTGVATVNSSGVVTAKAEGSTTITVKDGLGVSRTTSITVKSVKITSPTASVSLLVGQTYSFSGQGFGQLSWSTSNSVGSIASNGTNTATFTASSTTTGSVTVSMRDANNNSTINTITVTVSGSTGGGGGGMGGGGMGGGM